ncbi:MAG: methyltransferase domain-containing protein [Candidatus Aenigmarchaeota archaeon]|nr:methyltransferase domain-containing protein [Candidatus Aenigmarchaeota archaeon]
MNENLLYMPENHMDKVYKSKNPLVSFIHNKRINSIAKLIPLTEKLNVLDAGCGEGHLIEKMHDINKNNNYYGIDITKIALKNAKKRCTYANLKCTDLRNIDYDNSFFDIVVCTEVLEHIKDYEIVIKEISRLVKKKGRLIVTFPNEFLWTLSRFMLFIRPIKVPDHYNSFTPKKIISVVDMKVIKIINLPFRSPFSLSLCCLIEFEKV